MKDDIKKQVGVRQKVSVFERIRNWRVLAVIVIALILGGIGAVYVVDYVARNSPERVLADSIVNSLGVGKAKFTISYNQAAGKTGLKMAKLDGSYNKSKGYSANADVTFNQTGYNVAVKGRVVLDASANAYYAYDTVDDTQSSGQQYRMNAAAQQAVQDSFKTKWTSASTDVLGRGNSCVLELLQKSQNNPSHAATLLESTIRSKSLSVRSEASSGGTTVYIATVVPDKIDTFMAALKESKLYAGLDKCDDGAVASMTEMLKNTNLKIGVDASQRQVKTVDIEIRQGSNVNKVTIKITPDSSAQVVIPNDSQRIEQAK